MLPRPLPVLTAPAAVPTAAAAAGRVELATEARARVRRGATLGAIGNVVGADQCVNNFINASEPALRDELACGDPMSQR